MSTPLSVLIVEDSEDDTLLLIRELRSGGYEPTFERVDTPEAMNAALEQTWDIVIADYAMPHFSAPSALDMLKEKGLDLPFIIVSGAIGEETAVSMMKAGAHDYIMKGNVARLIPAIEREMRDAKVRQERKQAEEALRESEEKYRTILESIEEGYYEVDLAGSFTFFNDSLCRIIGYPKEETRGMNYREYTDEKNAKRLFETFNKVYTTGEPGSLFDYEVIGKDGTKRIHETSVSLIKDDKGQLTGFRGLDRDVTERRRLEAQLKQAQKMEAIGTVAGGVAHDLNNVLAGLVSYPELILMEMPEANPYREYILKIQNSGEKAAAIVQDLLTLARRGVAVQKWWI